MTDTGGWTAILLAGARPGADALAVAQGVASKAQILVAGVPMVARVAATLLECPAIARVVVLTQRPEDVRGLLPVADRLRLRQSAGSIAQTLARFAADDPAPWPLFVTTADHPLLTPATVAAFLQGVGSDDDVGLGVVFRSVVQRRFPGNRRTWIRVKDGDFTGANLFAFTGPRALAVLDLWAGVERSRKTGWRLVAKLGPWLLVRALLRRVTLQGALDEAGARLGARVRAVPLDDPLAAVDVDKVADLELATAVFEGRA